MEIKITLTGDAKQDRDALERGLQIFKKNVKKSGLLNEVRRREYYMPPSVYTRWRKNEAIKRRKRDTKRLDRTTRNNF